MFDKAVDDSYDDTIDNEVFTGTEVIMLFACGDYRLEIIVVERVNTSETVAASPSLVGPGHKIL